MPKATATGLILLAIGAGAGLYVALSGSGSQAEATTDPGSTNPSHQQADLFATNVAFDQLNPDGSLNYRLIAQAITQFPAIDAAPQYTSLDQPHFHLANAEEPPWNISAQFGDLREASVSDAAQSAESSQNEPEEVLHLTENVVMHQIHPENGELTIRSESFTIYPKREYAETRDDVIIDTKVGRTEAAGMRADLTSGLLVLTSSTDTQGNNRPTTKRVRTVVLPEQFK